MGSCCGTTGAFAALSRAAAKSAAGRLRRLGLLPEAVDWARRASVCETCLLRTIHRGVSYCGRPFLHQVERDPSEVGCGCPTRDKARTPGEHCPLDARHHAARRSPGGCTCKWCDLARR